jgi:diacylglycerol kinase (ATP)
MNDKWLIVANPASGNGKVGQNLEKIKVLFEKNNISSTLQLSTRPRELTALVENALNTEGYRHIAGIGGDGTMNEIVNGFFKQNTIETKDITFTMLPIGTGNDWATTHKISNDFERFIKMLKNGKTVYQDIGVVDYTQNGIFKKHYFANAGGLAYDALVVKSVESQKKYIFGKKIAYFLHILKCLWAYSPDKVRLRFNDQVVEDYFYTINLGINKTSGGGMYMTPQAVNDDGLMALTLIRNLPKWRVILYTTKLHKGTIGSVLRDVSLYQAKEIVINAIDKPLYIEVDGELLGETPIKITILEKVLKVLVP